MGITIPLLFQAKDDIPLACESAPVGLTPRCLVLVVEVRGVNDEGEVGIPGAGVVGFHHSPQVFVAEVEPWASGHPAGVRLFSMPRWT